jgi:penicillin amidase
MKHLILGGRYPAWVGFDRGPLVVVGGRATIHQGQIYKSGGRETSFAPSYRFVTALNEPVSHTALAGGPSDRRFSRWYVSDLENWKAGRLKELKPLGES